MDAAVICLDEEKWLAKVNGFLALSTGYNPFVQVGTNRNMVYVEIVVGNNLIVNNIASMLAFV